MSFLSKFLSGGRNTPDDTQATSIVEIPETRAPAAPDNKGIWEDEAPDHTAQIGVQKIEAVTLTWSKKGLAALLILIWVLFLTNGFRLSILYNLMPYVTSSFQSHSLLTVINIVASAMSAAVYIPMAKMLDVWGRAEGFLLMVGCSTLGLILMAASNGLAMFCAADVFYSVGFAGLIYSIVVLAADATNLRNRGLAFAFTSSPYMITAFAGSKAAEGYLKHVNWRWGFGSFAIILPIVTFPLFMVLKLNQRKAEKKGLIIRESSGRTFVQSVWHGIVDTRSLPETRMLAAGTGLMALSFGWMLLIRDYNVSQMTQTRGVVL